MAGLMTHVLPWLEARLGLAHREEGQDGMEYAVVAAIVIFAVGAALTAGSPTIQTIVNAALARVSAAIP